MHIKKRNEYYPYRYETIISRELFDQCQDVCVGRKHYVGDYNSKSFLFKVLLTCATTGCKVTGEHKKKTHKNGNTAEWIYLSAWNPDDPKKKVWMRSSDTMCS